MKVKLRLFANLRKYGPDPSGDFSLDMETGATVGRVIEKLGIPDEVKRVVLLNGRHAKSDTLLAENDGITLFPPMTGG